MPKIIISYRRSDSDVFAGRIRDRLAGRYGDAAVFMDIDDIPFGIDFRQHIKGALAASDVVIAIIGSRWLGVGKSGNARIQDEADPVRIEVEAALQNGIPVIPVLVGDTKMPKPAQLPETLKDFAFLNAATVDTGRDFHPHMERLLRSIDHILGDAKNEEQPGSTKEAARTERMPERASRRNQPVTILTIGVLVVVLGIGLVQFLPSVLAPKVEPSPPAPQTTLRLPTPTPQQVAPAPASQQVAPTPASQQLAATPPGLPALPVIPAEGLSFSCQDARSPVEVVICGDAELARKDRLLAELAEFLKGRRPSDEKLKSEHAAWQGARDQCRGAGILACVHNAYDVQIAKLKKGPSYNCQLDKRRVEQAICADVVLATKDQVMDELYISLRSSQRPEARQALADGQKRWLAMRDACEGPEIKSCVGRSYDLRFAELDKLSPAR